MGYFDVSLLHPSTVSINYSLCMYALPEPPSAEMASGCRRLFDGR